MQSEPCAYCIHLRVGEVVKAATRSLSGGRKATKFWPHCTSCHTKVCKNTAGTQLVTGPILWSDLPSLGPGLSVRAASAAAVQHHLQPSMPTTLACASMLPVRSSQTSQVLPELSVLAPGAAAHVQQPRQQEMSAASTQQHVQPVMPAGIARAMEPPGRFFQPSQYEPNLPAPPPLMTHPCAKVQQDCEADLRVVEQRATTLFQEKQVVEESLATTQTALKQAEGRVANLLVVEQRATTLLQEKQVVEESLATAETALKQAEGRVAHLTLENAQVRDAVLDIQTQLDANKAHLLVVEQRATTLFQEKQVVEESLATTQTALKQAEGRVANLLVVEQRATTLLQEKQVVEESLATAETALKQAEGRVAHLTLENAQVRDAVLNIQNQLPTVKTSKRDRDSDQDRELAAINRTSRTGWQQHRRPSIRLLLVYLRQPTSHHRQVKHQPTPAKQKQFIPHLSQVDTA